MQLNYFDLIHARRSRFTNNLPPDVCTAFQQLNEHLAPDSLPLLKDNVLLFPQVVTYQLQDG